MKSYILLLLFLVTTQLLYTQNIKGTVLEASTEKPLKDVHVYINNRFQVTSTDEFGKYSLKLSSQIKTNDTIFFSFIGYKTQKLLYSKKKKNYSVNLIKDELKLDNVELVWQKKLNLSLRFNKLKSMKRGLHSFGSLLKDNKIYVVGGDASTEINELKKLLDYDPENAEAIVLAGRAKSNNFSRQFYKGNLLKYDIALDTWEISDQKFRRRAYHSLNHSNNKIYVLGGKRLSMGRKYEYLDDKIEVFDEENNSIIIDDTNPHQAVDFVSFTYDDKIIVMGGSIKKKKSGIKEYSNKVHLYDLKSGLWYELATMPSAKEVSGVLIDNKIYLMGGFNKNPLTEIETFDLISGKWAKEGDLFKGLTNPAITHKNDDIYLFEDGKIIRYNIITKELQEYLIDLNLKSSQLYSANNKLYILGGFRENNYSVTPSNELYSIDLNEFKKTKINKSKRL